MYHADERSAVGLGISKSKAANDDAVPASRKLAGPANKASVPDAAAQVAAGWSAYDVWCSRIRDPRRQREIELQV